MYLSPWLGKMSAAVRVGCRRAPDQLLNITDGGITETRNDIGMLRSEANDVRFEARYVANMLPRTVGTVKNGRAILGSFPPLQEHGHPAFGAQ